MVKRRDKVKGGSLLAASSDQLLVMATPPRTPERLDSSHVESLLKTPPFSSQGGRTSPTWDEYHALEYFDINPKTDYTYAHSGSYSPKYFNQPDIIPNMSRPRIDSHASGYSFHQSGLEMPSSASYISQSMRQETRFQESSSMLSSRKKERRHTISNVDERSDHDSYSRVTYTTNGMVLRSGNRLKNVGSYLERNNNYGSSVSDSQSLVRSLTSDFDASDVTSHAQHSTPLSHLYEKQSESSEDVSLGTSQLGLSSIFSPRMSVRTVVTKKTVEYIDVDGRRRSQRHDHENDSRRSSRLSETFSERTLPKPELETSIVHEDSEVVTEKPLGKGGLFGIFQKSETKTEEEEGESDDVKETEDHTDHTGWFGLFRRSTTREEELVEARKQALASESDSESEDGPGVKLGWRNRFRNLLTRTDEEKWQTESVKETDKDGIRYPEDRLNWLSWFRTKTSEDVETEEKQNLDSPDSGGGWFGWIRSRRSENARGENDPKVGWFGWTKILETSTTDDVDRGEPAEETEAESNAGWFRWSSKSSSTETEDQADPENESSKSRLFAWLKRSSETKIAEDMSETESPSKSKWFSWLHFLTNHDDADSPNRVLQNGHSSSKKTSRRRRGRRVTFSLDSEEDNEVDRGVSEKSSSTSLLTGSSRGTSRSSSYTSSFTFLPSDRSQTWMQIFLTTLTTITSFLTGLLSPITDSYAYRHTKLVIWRQLRIAEMWLVSRSVGGCCCLCLPLLLLLPLLLGYLYGGDLLEQARASVKSFTLLSVNNTRAEPLPYIDPSTISIKIQQFFEAHKHQYELSQLTEKDVERIAQGMIAKELEEMKLALLGNINQMKSDQAASRTEQRASFTSLDVKLGDILSNYAALEKDIAALKTAGNVQVEDLQKDVQSQILVLEQQMKSLGDDVSSLHLSHHELLASVRNCCRNDSFYALAVRKHVREIFEQMMAGSGSSGDETDRGYGAFLHWLQTNYARKEDMDLQLAKVSEDITQRVLTITKEQASNVYIQSDSRQTPGISEDYIRWVVDDALLKFSADQVGMADYALESAGGSVVSVRCSETYYRKTALVSVFGIPLWYTTNSPRTVIQPEVHPGQCWAFKGVHGFIVVQLAFPIKPSGFTLEHIPKALSPTGKIDSAPKEFTVLGLESESDKVGVSLGNYTYAESGKPIQYFPIQASNSEFFEFVELRVQGNHGNPEYTCIYRFRVHGLPYKPL